MASSDVQLFHLAYSILGFGRVLSAGQLACIVKYNSTVVATVDIAQVWHLLGLSAAVISSSEFLGRRRKLCVGGCCTWGAGGEGEGLPQGTQPFLKLRLLSAGRIPDPPPNVLLVFDGFPDSPISTEHKRFLRQTRCAAKCPAASGVRLKSQGKAEIAALQKFIYTKRYCTNQKDGELRNKTSFEALQELTVRTLRTFVRYSHKHAWSQCHDALRAQLPEAASTLINAFGPCVDSLWVALDASVHCKSRICSMSSSVWRASVSSANCDHTSLAQGKETGCHLVHLELLVKATLAVGQAQPSVGLANSDDGLTPPRSHTH